MTDVRFSYLSVKYGFLMSLSTQTTAHEWEGKNTLQNIEKKEKKKEGKHY